VQIGPYEVTAVHDGTYRLDGGSMFGVVPRVLWERQHPPDERNRIEIALRCLLLRGEGRVILVDNGMGRGWSEKERDIYGLRRERGDLLEDLARHGVAPEEVTDMVLTHLHFDHAGGTVRVPGEDDTLTFPRATHWLQTRNLEWAEQPTERDRASYRGERWAPLRGHPQLRLLDGEQEFLPSLRALPVHGHTPGQQLVLVGGIDEPRLLYCADLLPFASHLRMPWIMSFDLHPLLTLTEKQQLLQRALAEDWILCFEHDPAVEAVRVERRDGHCVVAEELSL